MSDSVRIAVIGTGHVGLVVSVAFSSMGHRVTATDIDVAKIETLQEGNVPFFEPQLERSLRHELDSGRLTFTTDPADALGNAEAVFICVGTPARANGEANLTAVEAAAQDIRRHAPRGVVVVEKSTVPAGTADRIRSILPRDGDDGWFDVASSPEFLREGTALDDMLDPSRIVIGVESERAGSVLRRIYEPLVRRGAQLIEVGVATAELAKHASNSFLALKISFINAMARVCERTGADVGDVAAIMGADPRIGREFLGAGLGYGGYCFPKDVQALRATAQLAGYDIPLLDEVQRINDEAVGTVALMVRDALWNLEGKRIALLGLAFKPGTDDVRFSPALKLAERLMTEGADVVGYDPVANESAARELPDLKIASSVLSAVVGAHCMVVATEWSEFQSMPLELIVGGMARPLIIDARRALDGSAAVAAGFDYRTVGRRRD